jgi:hypothetical protein
VSGTFRNMDERFLRVPVSPIRHISLAGSGGVQLVEGRRTPLLSYNDDHSRNTVLRSDNHKGKRSASPCKFACYM